MTNGTPLPAIALPQTAKVVMDRMGFCAIRHQNALPAGRILQSCSLGISTSQLAL